MKRPQNAVDAVYLSVEQLVSPDDLGPEEEGADHQHKDGDGGDEDGGEGMAGEDETKDNKEEKEEEADEESDVPLVPNQGRTVIESGEDGEVYSEDDFFCELL